MDATEVASIGFLLGILATIALLYSATMLSMEKPRITNDEQSGALLLHYRPTSAVPLTLMCVLGAPTLIGIGYINSIPQAMIGGIAAAIVAIAIPIVVLFQLRRAALRLQPESLRVTTLFDDVECKWGDIQGVHISTATPGLDAVTIRYKEGTLLLHKRAPLFSSAKNASGWEIPTKAWGVSMNSLVSTISFLHANQEARNALDETQLEAMLSIPEWARPGR